MYSGERCVDYVKADPLSTNSRGNKQAHGQPTHPKAYAYPSAASMVAARNF